MKGIKHGFLYGFLFVLVAIGGCSLQGGKQSSPGPVRGDNPISGDLTNADIQINDPRLLYGFMGLGLIGVGGFALLSWKLAKHHSSINRVTLPSRS